MDDETGRPAGTFPSAPNILVKDASLLIVPSRFQSSDESLLLIPMRSFAKRP